MDPKGIVSHYKNFEFFKHDMQKAKAMSSLSLSLSLSIYIYIYINYKVGIVSCYRLSTNIFAKSFN